jgi:hypothetical protein
MKHSSSQQSFDNPFNHPFNNLFIQLLSVLFAMPLAYRLPCVHVPCALRSRTVCNPFVGSFLCNQYSLIPAGLLMQAQLEAFGNTSTAPACKILTACAMQLLQTLGQRTFGNTELHKGYIKAFEGRIQAILTRPMKRPLRSR